MLRKVLVFLLLLIVSVLGYAETEIYFSPSDHCENKLADWMAQAKDRIDAAVYAINNKKIVAALKQAYDRGVQIRILTDRLQAANKYSRVTELYNYGIDIRVHSKHRIEHNKFAIFDGLKVSTGSYNWTTPASEQNSENCVFFTLDPRVVQTYQQRFDYLWQINTKDASDAWFHRQK